MMDELDGRIRQFLSALDDETPSAPPLSTLFAREGSTAGRHVGRPLRLGLSALIASALVAIVLVQAGGSHKPASKSNGTTPIAPTTASSEVPPPASTNPASPVLGTPVCGASLPFDVRVPRVVDGPVNGPIAGPTVAPGQYAQHWELADGSIELRWPVDDQALYDLDRTGGDPAKYDNMDVGLPDGGGGASIRVPSIDPGVGQAPSTDPGVGPNDVASTLVVTLHEPRSPTTEACARFQIRVLDRAGNRHTVTFSTTDLTDRPLTVLDPIITTTSRASAPPPDTDLASCHDQAHLGGNPAQPATAPSPAEALRDFLTNSAPAGLARAGYDELQLDADHYSYLRRFDGNLATIITAERSTTGWRVTRWAASAC